MEYKTNLRREELFNILLICCFWKLFCLPLENGKKFSDIIYKKLLINFTKAVQCCVLVVNLGELIREFLSIYAF